MTTLAARLPLTKTFVMNGGRITATPYPHVSRVTSTSHTVSSLAEFKDVLTNAAARQECLFNGQMTRPLTNESRAGMTADTKREWIVFDFDRVEARDHREVVSKFLPAECQNVSYIVQLSASMFRPDTTTWSGHIFMLLREPMDQQRVKQWFEYLNFNLPELTKQLALSDSLHALHWPLDRTVAYNSKLIYIAPPKCHGFKPVVDQHIELVKKRQASLSIPTFQPIDTVTIRQKINELRRNIGESDIDYDLTQYDGHEMLRKVGELSIEGIRTSGDHYIRFNLNGGDSYAYFIDLRNPEIIRNFKGEPYLSTKDAAPDLYKSLRRVSPQAVAKAPLDDGTEVLAFYATNQNSTIRLGTFNPIERKVTLNGGSETAARAWRAEYGLTQKEFLPHYDLTFDPTSDVQFAHGINVINTFRITDYMARSKSSDTPSTLDELPPVTRKILTSILGDPDDYVIRHFVNWLAYIFQYRQKTQTAWVLNGVPGTGKGSFAKYFLRPLFGPEQVVTIQYSNIKGEFNGFLENALFVLVEEANINAAENADDIMSKLLLWITDSPLPIRRMRTDVYDAPNYSNFILSTNNRTPAKVTGDDRRFNFGERQENRWFPTPNELRVMTSGSELEQFADILHRWPVDSTAAAMVIDTEAKRDAHEATTPINQLVAEAIQRGDLQFFIDRLPSDAEAQADFYNRFNPIGMFKLKIDEYVEAATAKQPSFLSEEDLFVLFRTLITDARYFQDSKTWRKRHYKSLGLDVDKRHRVPGAKNAFTRGVRVQWQVPSVLPESSPPIEEPQGNVTPIKRGRKK